MTHCYLSTPSGTLLQPGLCRGHSVPLFTLPLLLFLLIKCWHLDCDITFYWGGEGGLDKFDDRQCPGSWHLCRTSRILNSVQPWKLLWLCGEAHLVLALSVLHLCTFMFPVLDVDAFERLLGPCMELMQRNIDDYEDQLVAVFGDKANISDLRGKADIANTRWWWWWRAAVSTLCTTGLGTAHGWTDLFFC